jgi:uncharacterized repeat protein (TIGR04138 family)
MQENAFLEIINNICTKDERYPPEAYLFVRQALDTTVKALDKPKEGPNRHVTGQELLEGIRLFTLQEFGPMSLTVLQTWNINNTNDFGNIVFNMVESGILGSTAEDSKTDFSGGYDFNEAFKTPFLPNSAK